MTELRKMANAWLEGRPDYQEYYRNGIPQNNYDDIVDAFEAGFRKALEMAIDIWEDDDHVYCDFYGRGGAKLERMGDAEKPHV